MSPHYCRVSAVPQQHPPARRPSCPWPSGQAPPQAHLEFGHPVTGTPSSRMTLGVWHRAVVQGPLLPTYGS